jgi:hypothetical protein
MAGNTLMRWLVNHTNKNSCRDDNFHVDNNKRSNTMPFSRAFAGNQSAPRFRWACPKFITVTMAAKPPYWVTLSPKPKGVEFLWRKILGMTGTSSSQFTSPIATDFGIALARILWNSFTAPTFTSKPPGRLNGNEMLLFPDDFHQYALAPATVKFAVETVLTGRSPVFPS